MGEEEKSNWIDSYHKKVRREEITVQYETLDRVKTSQRADERGRRSRMDFEEFQRMGKYLLGHFTLCKI